ncbi:hypothetical protein PIB30_115025, partial [Stylosanthes scabra]|nr:hypothetical protein [Stylosanthes scabra]
MGIIRMAGKPSAREGVGATGVDVVAGAEVSASASPRSRGTPVIFLGRPLRPRVPLPPAPRSPLPRPR